MTGNVEPDDQINTRTLVAQIRARSVSALIAVPYGTPGRRMASVVDLKFLRICSELA
jgi:hypothetical protein